MRRCNNNQEIADDKSGYYGINNDQWTFCNITAIIACNFISTCAGMRGRWKRIASINISSGDNCPGEWRKAAKSGVTVEPSYASFLLIIQRYGDQKE